LPAPVGLNGSPRPARSGVALSSAYFVGAKVACRSERRAENILLRALHRVVGSSPIIRVESRARRGFCCLGQERGHRQFVANAHLCPLDESRADTKGVRLLGGKR